MSIFDKLIYNNEFPIIFIGSGMSKRYLHNYPNWEELLEEFWNMVSDSNFYAHLNEMKNSLISLQKERNEQVCNDDISFLININVAKEIEEKVKDNFFKESLMIEGLSQREVYQKNLSPFKFLLSKRFSDYEKKEDINLEFIEFQNMLIKSQIILTTNYDTLIEDAYNEISKYKIQKYVGQNGFFQQTSGYSELYKIHGCINEPESLVMNKEDYDKFDENSILISAKIISSLLNSPIIFLGYSLTDRNVRKIIKDFTSSLNDIEKKKLEDRLIVIQREEDLKEIKEEVLSDKELNCRLTFVKTDNFMEIFKKIQNINQGVTPSVIRKYHNVFKELIVSRGKQGILDTLLISPDVLDDVEKLTKDSNVVVAIGDYKIIFKMPNTLDYIFDYISENTNQNLEIILKFLAKEPTKAILPMIKYNTESNIENSTLHQTEKEKLRTRLKNHKSLRSQIKNLQCKDDCVSLEEILKQRNLKYREYSLIAYNITKFNLDDVKNYILKELSNLIENKEIKVDTNLRRLALIYDLKKNS